MYQSLDVASSEVEISCFLSSIGVSEYVLRIEKVSNEICADSTIFDIRLTLAQVQKIANAMRHYAYPRYSSDNEERVKMCITTTVPKKLLTTTSSEATPMETLSNFLKSFRVEDTALETGSAENSSTETDS